MLLPDVPDDEVEIDEEDEVEMEDEELLLE